MAELKDKCVTPARGPILPAIVPAAGNAAAAPAMEAQMSLVKVGQEAIDFEAPAFIAGVGAKPVKLSDYKGKWIVICFYPGDFTFV